MAKVLTIEFTVDDGDEDAVGDIEDWLSGLQIAWNWGESWETDELRD